VELMTCETCALLNSFLVRQRPDKVIASIDSMRVISSALDSHQPVARSLCPRPLAQGSVFHCVRSPRSSVPVRLWTRNDAAGTRTRATSDAIEAPAASQVRELAWLICMHACKAHPCHNHPSPLPRMLRWLGRSALGALMQT
jgi:hypothetical protein